MGTIVNSEVGPGRPLELSRLFTPLGIRFWDLTLNVAVTDGLAVYLQPANNPGRSLTAVRSSTGIYTFFGIPGMRAVEYQDAAGFGPPRTFSYVVTVEDKLTRFLPMMLVYTLDSTGALLVNGVPDATRGPRLAYVFSAPGRAAPPGVAMVRAQLADAIDGGAAAWAVVRVQVGGHPEVWTGIADGRGQVAILFPYPLVEKLTVGSPPGSGAGTGLQQTWPVTVQVRYNPAVLGFPLANVPDLEWPWTVTPSLKTILEDQQPATVWPDTSTPLTELPAVLTYGQELVLRSAAPSPPSLLSALTISRGTSPP
jgi:hypothetical protein